MKDIVTQLRMNSECLAPSIMLDAADTIEHLRKERDEARRELCRWAFKMPQLQRKLATDRGWDCWKEDGK